MPQVKIIIKVQDTGGTPEYLRWAWVYWKVGGNTTLLRTDNEGRVFNLNNNGDRTRPWEYTAIRFTSTTGTVVDIYFSRGAKPIPDARLNEHVGVFHRRTVNQAPPGTTLPASEAQVAPISPNVLTQVPTALITLPNHLLELTIPLELRFWPLLWELPTDQFQTDNLPAGNTDLIQGATLWDARGQLTVPENQRPAAAQAPRATVRPRERGLALEGRIDRAATGVTIKILDSGGNILQLRQNIGAGAAVTEIQGTLAPAGPRTRDFQAAIFFVDAVNAFGPVQIFLISAGLNPPIIEAFAVHLCGFQIGLADDFETNANGLQPGPARGEADEYVVVDFIDSPQRNAVALPNRDPSRLTAQTRARRMVRYRFANRQRALDSTRPVAAGNPNILKPQMPMWMAEFQMVGVTRPQLQDLMARRYFEVHHGARDPATPLTVSIDLGWSITLKWDGPDSNNRIDAGIFARFPGYSYTYPAVPAVVAKTVQLHFGHQGQFTDAGAQNIALAARHAVPNAFSPAPTRVSFPVANRRLPEVTVADRNVPWGRQAAAVQKESLIIDWQPRVVSGVDEIIRGGDGIVELRTIAFEGQRIHAGLVPNPIAGQPNPLVAPPAGDPYMRLPWFRIRGLNGPGADMLAIARILAEAFFNDPANNASAHVTLLPVGAWQITAERIFQHESGGQFHQFLDRAPGRYLLTDNNMYYGWERDTPFFGGPDGYGLVQRDPPDNDDILWSFVENIRRGVREVFEKGQAAFNFLSAGAGGVAFNALAARRQQAIYQRELVRRYNGGREFRFQGGNWVVRAQTMAAHFDYCNGVLGTNMGPYPGPLVFNDPDPNVPGNMGDYGPGI